ncbi:MAG: J domain-containing protein [Deltaproteobacteria bacterium]|nr:J domain-containing protein [Deltaproteobacteria bacterium]
MSDTMALKDNYYHILGIDQRAGPEEIKQAYRQLALKYQPDRNPGDMAAEERFKLMSEAYAVLTDPVKRSQYDRTLAPDFDHRREPDHGFTYTQEDILRDFFSSPDARQAFRDLSQEFKRFGFRFDEKFLQRLFFGGRGFFFSGIFFTGPFFGRMQRRQRPISESSRRIGLWGRVGQIIKQKAQQLIGPSKQTLVANESDIKFNLTISEAQAASGMQAQVAYKRNGRTSKISVRIPPGTRDGARLRLKNMGRHRSDGTRGDLYLHIRVSS